MKAGTATPGTAGSEAGFMRWIRAVVICRSNELSRLYRGRQVRSELRSPGASPPTA